LSVKKKTINKIRNVLCSPSRKTLQNIIRLSRCPFRFLLHRFWFT